VRLLVHDYCGHPFQAELSRALSHRGHEVTHSFCDAYVSGKGDLKTEDGETVRFEPIGVGLTLHKMQFHRRVFQELGLGVQLVRQVRRNKPDVVMAANVPIPMLVVFALAMKLMRVPWVLWHQDVQCVAIRSFAGAKLSRGFRVVAAAIEVGERWCARQARQVVVIAESFVAVHQAWHTDAKVTVIPNWAPLEEIRPQPRANGWATAQGLDQVKTLLYSGTLGLKHNPTLLVRLARKIVDAGQPVELVVINEGPAVEPLRQEAEKLQVSIRLLPFQPYDQLPEVLASGDLLVVLLEKSAGAFSVPSKTLSYLCAGRPVIGLMPGENAAAQLLSSVGGCVLPPDPTSLDEAAAWAIAVLQDPERAGELGRAARDLAESEFSLEGCVGRFEEILERSRNGSAGSLAAKSPMQGDHIPDTLLNR
jgi:colanic acid biosynthesis glycosyl transferase WcaI